MQGGLERFVRWFPVAFALVLVAGACGGSDTADRSRSDEASSTSLPDSEVTSTTAASTTTTISTAAASWEFTLKTREGWSYAFTLRYTPASGFAKDITNSPPGQSAVTMARSATYEIVTRSVDEGRNAPTAAPVKAVRAFFASRLPAMKFPNGATAQLPGCQLAGYSFGSAADQVPAHPDHDVACFAYSRVWATDAKGNIEYRPPEVKDEPGVDAWIAEWNAQPAPLFLHVELQIDRSGAPCSFFLFADKTVAPYRGCTLVRS